MIKRLFKYIGSMTPELAMLANRFVLGSVACAASSLLSGDPIIYQSFAAYLLTNLCLLILYRKSIATATTRIATAIICDSLVTLAIMLPEAQNTSFMYPLFLWMTLGTGFRLGTKWLLFAATMCTVTFSIIVYSTDYWQNNFVLGNGLITGLLVIPAYCSTLINKISLAKEQAEIASRAKSYFLTSVSHELRTPLNAIIGYGSHLRNMDMPRNQKEMVEASVHAGEHLLHMIDQLIQVGKSETGSIPIKKADFRITTLLAEIRDIMLVRVEESGLNFGIQAEPMSDMLVSGPLDIIRNILINLVGNALKFTQSGSIVITAGYHDIDGKLELWFAVKDTGIGVAKDAQERIFQAFQQADDSVMNRFGGTGLGLAICRQLASQVKGRISIDSDLGLGSKFTVTIPVDKCAVDDVNSHDDAQDAVRILSLGMFDPALLTAAQSAGNYSVRHIDCSTVEQLESAITSNDLQPYSVAIIDQRLVNHVSSDDPLWKYFIDAEIAPVLVQHDSNVDLEDISLRAAFATVIPATADFDAMRSAIRIGCSFAKQSKFEEQPKPITKVTSRSVLVADDNRTNRNVLAAILESAGHVVHMVEDGDDALDALEQGGYEILLLDVNMPRLNGIDACKMWRQIEGPQKHIPIIGVTADATAETEKNCLCAGMDYRLTKPVNALNLLNIIERYCSQNVVALPSSIDDPLQKIVSINPAQTNIASSIDPEQINYLASIGDAHFVTEMIGSCFDDFDEIIEQMRLSIAQNDVKKFRFCAHAFKSSSNNIGATLLSAICHVLENITEDDFKRNKNQHMEKIESECAKAIAELKQICESFTQPHKKAG